MKQVYLKRAIISRSLWLAMIVLIMLTKGSASDASSRAGNALLVLLPGFALAIMLGKAIMETVSDLTGMTFFSGLWLLFFYAILTAFSLVIAPVYCLWNLIRYFTTSDAIE